MDTIRMNAPRLFLAFLTLFLTAAQPAWSQIPPPDLDDALTGKPIEEGTRNLVICIHGWNNPREEDRYRDTPEWAWLVATIDPVMKANTLDPWSLLLYDWHEDADTGFWSWNDPLNVALPYATQAAINATPHGTSLAARLPKSLRRVHIIAHSAGTWCLREAVVGLLEANPYVVIQVTLLDPFIPEAVAPSGGLYSKQKIQELASMAKSERVYLFENYYANDFPITFGTQETFSWRPGDLNLQVEWNQGTIFSPNWIYDFHSGPTLFYGDTIAAAGLDIILYRLPPTSPPYVYQGYGWYNSLFHRTQPQWASLPRITAQPPKTTTVASGSPVTLSVQASSILPLSYQWFKRGQANPIAGAAGASYNFTASTASAGDYVVRVRDSTGQIYSDVATVTVSDAPPPTPTLSVASVLPSTLPGLTLPQTQLIRILGSGFTSGSTLVLNDGFSSFNSDSARLTFISANELRYQVAVGTDPASWTVRVINGTQQSNLGYFSVVNPPPDSGSLTVTLSPSAAVTAGAQWRVDGGTYRNSGDTVNGLTPGSHTVSFKSVSGYTKPAEKSVSITAGANTATTGSYSVAAPTTYTLNLSATHGHITARPDMNNYPAGTEVRLIATPDDGYLFDYWSGNASGSERTIYVTMNRNRSITANFTLDTTYGHIRVNLSPPQVVAEGAQWKYRNYTAWRDSGDLQDYIPTGGGNVYFKNIPGWIAPAQVQATVVGGQTTEVNATYQEILGGVQVTLAPAQAGTAGARWRLDGGPWTESGVTLADVSTGNHLIEFLALPGWVTPPSQMVSVERGLTSFRNADYGPPPGLPIITAVSPRTGPLAGGTEVTIDGVNFQPGATVSFGGVAATSVTVVSPTRITAITPARNSYGTVPLSLVSGGQTVNQANGFSYLNPLGSNIELVGQFGGNVEAVDVVGNMAYYGEGPGLVVADFSNSAAPVERGRIALPSMVKGLVVVSNIAFVATGSSGLYAVNVENPAAPSIVGFYDTEGFAWGVTVIDGIAYVADASAGLQLLDVTNPSAIVRLGGVDTLGRTERVAVGTFASKKYAFVAEGDLALRVIDVTLPAAPMEVTSFPGQTAEGITDVKLAGTTLFISDWQNVVKIFDVSNPTNLIQTGSRNNVGGGAFIDVVGNRLYTCSGGLNVADLTVMPTPTVLGYFDVGSFCDDLVVSNGLAFAAMGRDGLKVVSVSNPAAMSLRSAVETFSGVEDIWVSGDVAFVGNGAGLHALDVSNPPHPTRMATLAGDRVTDIVLADGKATLVNYGDEVVRVASVANPSSPGLLGTYTNIEAYNVALLGSTPVLVGATRDGTYRPILNVLNLSVPSNPQTLGSLLLGSNDVATSVAVAGTWAFVGRNSVLDVVTLANPASPQKVGSLAVPVSTLDIAATGDGNFVYVPVAGGIQVVDTAQKSMPILGQLIDLPLTTGGIRTLHLSANRLFVEETGFLYVLDISTPASPQLVGYYDLPGSAFGIDVAGDLIFVAGYSAGVNVLRVKDVNKPTVAIASPTANTTYATTNASLALGGTASDDKAVALVSWVNNRGGSGEATGTNSWSAAGLLLLPGENVLTVTAYDQQGNEATDSLTVTYTPPPQSQTITFAPLPDRTFGDPVITLHATAGSGLPITFTVLAGPAMVLSNQLTLLGAGSVTVRATQTGNAEFLAASFVDRMFEVVKAEQSITFTTQLEYWFTDPPVALSATASSGLPVSFAVVSGPATLNGNMLTLTGPGEVTVQAQQAGNANFLPAPAVDRTLAVTKVAQFITFGALSRQVFGDTPFELSATANSGLPVTYSVLGGPALVSGNIVTMTGPGLVVLRASQAGDATYAPAPHVDQVLMIAPGNNVIADYQKVGNNLSTFRFYGESGINYVVQASTNLVDWQPLATNQVSALGFFEFIDIDSTNHSSRFYRIAP